MDSVLCDYQHSLSGAQTAKLIFLLLSVLLDWLVSSWTQSYVIESALNELPVLLSCLI